MQPSPVGSSLEHREAFSLSQVPRAFSHYFLMQECSEMVVTRELSSIVWTPISFKAFSSAKRYWAPWVRRELPRPPNVPPIRIIKGLMVSMKMVFGCLRG